MRKHFIIFLVTITLTCTLLINSFNSFGGTTVFAQSEEQAIPSDLGQEISRNLITDGNLYDGLISEFNKMYESMPDYEPVDKVYVNMFSQASELNLENKLIYNLNGFSMLNLPNLTHLNLSKNRISEIKLNLLNATNLTHLNLHDNRLTDLNLNYLPNITEINLNNNLLTKVNLSQIKEGKILLNANLFNYFSNIRLSEEPVNLAVELINNNLANVPAINGVKYELGLLGVRAKETDTVQKIQTNNLPKFFPFTNYDIKLNVYNNATNELVKSYQEEDTLNLPFGSYYAYYVNNDDENVYNLAHPLFSAFKPSGIFEIVPSTPTVAYVVNEKSYNSYNEIMPKGSKITFSTYDESAKIYYKISDGDWQEGKAVSFTDGGIYNLEIKSVVNGHESEVVRTSIRITTSELSNFVMWLIISLAIFFAIIGYMFLKQKNIINKK